MGDAGHRIDIGGNARGPVIAGDYNVVVDAQHGSAVTLLVERERPVPVRRDRVTLLPRQQRELVGRDAESVALAEAIRAGGPVQLCGPPGVGKSTLLRHAAHTVEPGPDGVVYLSGAHREVGDLAQEMFEACYDAVGYAPSNTELRRLMSEVRVTVYVDNADLTLEQMRDLTDSAPAATFVFASADRSLLGDGTVVELEGLDHTAGLRLLSRELRRPIGESELGTATDLWQAAAGRPLFLLRAAGLARADGSGTMVLPAPGAIADLIPLLLSHLDDAALSVLHLLATLDDIELDPVHIGALTGVPAVAELCEHLTGLGLTVSSERGTRCTPDAVSVLRQRNPQPFPAELLCGYFTRWASQPATTPAQVADHGPALEKIAGLAEWAGRPDLAVQVTRAASPTLARSLRFGAWGRLLGRGWNAAQQSGDRSAAAYFMHEEGIRSLLTGRRVLAVALLAEVAVLWKQLGDTHGATAALHAQHYVPAAPHAAVTPAAHGGAATAGNGATATQASTATNGATAGNSATAGHTTAGNGATAGHTTAGHSTTAAQNAPAGHSATGHTATGHSATGHTAAGHGATGHSATGHGATAGHSAAGHTAAGHGAAGHSAAGHTATGHGASAGHSAAGHTATGHGATAGHSTAGHSAAGHSATGHTAAGHAAAGHGTAGHGATAGHTAAGHGAAGHSAAGHTAAGHGASAGHSAAGHGAAGHSAAGHAAAGHGTAAHSAAGAHAAAGHGATAGHATAAHGSASSHVASSHMTQLGHSSAGHTAAAHAHHGAGHVVAGHAHHGVGHAAAVHAHHGAGHAAAAHLPHHAGHLAGMAGGGSTHVGTAAVAAKGISATTMVLIGAAVVGATTIGGIAIASHDDAPTGIVGTWSDGTGTVTVGAAGSGSYTLDIDTQCGRVTFKLTGNDDSATGVGPLLDESTCAHIGEVTVTVRAAPDGSTATFDSELAPGQPRVFCRCGKATLTRSR